MTCIGFFVHETSAVTSADKTQERKKSNFESYKHISDQFPQGF